MKRLLTFSFICVTILMLTISCSEDSEKSPSEPTLNGWTEFESGNYDKAVDYFLEATDIQTSYGEAYVGLCWSYGRLGDYTKSIENGEEAFAYVSDTDLKNDTKAGLGFSYFERNSEDDYNHVIEHMEFVLNQNSDYQFVHDNSITSVDLRLILALCFWYRDELESVQEQIDILDSDNGLNPSDPDSWEWTSTVFGDVDCPTYKEALIKKIEELQIIDD